MTRKDLKDIIARVVEVLEQDAPPKPACIFGDGPCDVTTKYAVGEES